MNLLSIYTKCFPDCLAKWRLNEVYLLLIRPIMQQAWKWAQCLIRIYNFWCCLHTYVKRTSPISKKNSVIERAGWYLMICFSLSTGESWCSKGLMSHGRLFIHLFKVLGPYGLQPGRQLHPGQILGLNHGSKAKVRIWEMEWCAHEFYVRSAERETQVFLSNFMVITMNNTVLNIWKLRK